MLSTLWLRPSPARGFRRTSLDFRLKWQPVAERWDKPYEAGSSQRAIAEMLGVSAPTAARILTPAEYGNSDLARAANASSEMRRLPFDVRLRGPLGAAPSVHELTALIDEYDGALPVLAARFLDPATPDAGVNAIFAELYSFRDVNDAGEFDDLDSHLEDVLSRVLWRINLAMEARRAAFPRIGEAKGVVDGAW